MLIGSTGARSALLSAGVAVTAATGGAWPELVAGAVTDGGAAVESALDDGVLVPDAAPVVPLGDPIVQPADAASSSAAIDPLTQR